MIEISNKIINIKILFDIINAKKLPHTFQCITHTFSTKNIEIYRCALYTEYKNDRFKKWKR